MLSVILILFFLANLTTLRRDSYTAAVRLHDDFWLSTLQFHPL